MQAIHQTLRFAVEHGLIEAEDIRYTRNRILDVMRMDAPIADQKTQDDPLPPTLTPMLNALTDDAARRGLIADTNGARELFANRLCGCVTPHPYEIRTRFQRLLDTEGPRAATEWFYELCRACDYIRVDNIARNVRYFADTDAGRLEITINLSKPEKDPRDIAAQRNAPKVGYPLCMLCAENPGYAGRLDFPARHNHRAVPLTLGGEKWYLQYSPYLYYPEHCIVFNETHRPMSICRQTFECLFDFVEQYPHYLIGSNADLPIVGGSILSHDHFQGGNYHFPMDDAKPWIRFDPTEDGVSATVLDWPLTCVNLSGTDRRAIADRALEILNAWRGYSDESLDILARTDVPHNTITPILRAMDGRWSLNLVLRNNRTTAENPLGIFHPHADLHHIKKENIGLIEVMGLFILPGRLLAELDALKGYLTGEKPLDKAPDADSPLAKHYEWALQLAAESGTSLTDAEAKERIYQGVARKCCRVLADAGVYKHDEAGRQGVIRFLNTLGYRESK
ncbi:MAG: UDP-glucose--hexose-1-phosphate uridylyltransferase [Clostridia bacterium]|nr:UDP-glucose--hexose-1-phosphate uridylyltransferase [Clostridia bacterium]